MISVNMILQLLCTWAVHTLGACIDYSCETLQSNQCAFKLSSEQVILNDDQCEDGFSCSLEDLVPWAESSEGGYLGCRSEEDLSLYKESNFQCGVKLPNKNLYIDSFPKLCLSEDDCLLEDGTYAECGCGMDGRSYCKASIHSDVFDDYWDECDNGVMEDEDEVVWWTIYTEYYLLTLGQPDCAEDVVWEFSYMTDVIEAAASSLQALTIVLALSSLH